MFGNYLPEKLTFKMRLLLLPSYASLFYLNLKRNFSVVLLSFILMVCLLLISGSKTVSAQAVSEGDVAALSTFDGRDKGKTYTGAWVTVSRAKINGSVISKQSFAFEFYGDYQHPHRGFGLSSVRTISSLSRDVAEKTHNSLGNRYFINSKSIPNIRKLINTLDRKDQEIVYLICDLMSQQGFIERAMQFMLKGRSSDAKFVSFWKNPARVRELTQVGETCLRQVRRLVKFDPPSSQPILASSNAASRLAPAETKARQDRRRQCFANKKVNVSDQKLLKSLGFYKSTIDGVMGAGSKAAILRAEKLLGPWADDMNECLGAGERTILEAVDKQKSSVASCVFGEKSKAEVFQLYNQLRSNGLITQTLGNFYPYQFAGFLNLIGKLENDLVVRGYYNNYWESNRGRRDCWLDKVEINKLLELSGNKSKIAQSVASKANALQDKVARPTLGKDDVSSSSRAETCEANPKLCSVVQLCQIATEMRNGKKAWKETSSSAPFIELAKANGVQCGVPSAPIIVEKVLSCEDDPTLCSVVQLCSRATQVVDGEKSWSETEDRTKFVELAKSNGLQCGVPIEPQVADVLPTCDDDPKLCSVLQLCEKSTELSGDKKTWSSSAASANYVELAKLSGLQCGVQREPVVVAAEPTCDDNPELCSVVQLCERAAKVEDGVRKWTEEERFRSYIDAAKAAGLTCGVQPTPAVVAQVPNCKTDPTLCSVAELCAVSTSFDSEGKKGWNKSSELSKHVSLAREQGVTCGVAQKPTLVTSGETCDAKPSLCSLADLCRKAISFETGSLGWTTDPKLTLHVEFAQNAGISCGVPSSVTINNVITQAAPKRDVAKEQSFGSYTNRKALVIGNSQYSQQTPLKNPRSDAETIARSLEKVGFEVELAFDLSRRDLGRAITSFSSRAKEADISLFYFAGHGIEIDSRNYLIPTDAIMDDPAALKYDVIDLEEAIDAVAGSSKLSLVMVDACRDNPFNNQVAGLNRSLSRGLKVIETDAVSKNQIVSFAAESGQVAEDGTGSNSPYAQIFSELVVQPNLEVGKMFRQLSDKVAAVTAGRQMPVSRNRLSGEDIFFLIER